MFARSQPVLTSVIYRVGRGDICNTIYHLLPRYSSDRGKRLYSTDERKNTKKTISNAPTEFTSNVLLTSKRLRSINNAVEKIRCTDEISEASRQMSHADANKNPSKPLPFNVKPIDPATRKAQRALRQNTSTLRSIRKQVIDPYIQLTKPRLTVLVMLSAICSYALSPNAASMSQLTWLTIGTTLCSGSANAINMAREPEFDRHMSRTQTRPVVRGAVTPAQAYKYAAAIGTIGVGTLLFGVNPTVAALGAFNIVLYAWIYTSLKRKHVINTWIGAIVGAIPPLMGWGAASSLMDPGAWCLAGLLYAWQFPHFNALSHIVRKEYKKAGYVMLAWTNPKHNAKVSLRYSLLMFPLCFGLAYFNVTDWLFLVDSSLVNGWITYWAFKFYQQQKRNFSPEIVKNESAFNQGLKLAKVYARETMLASVMHLPILLVLAILHRKGRWDWLSDKDKDSDDPNKI